LVLLPSPLLPAGLDQRREFVVVNVAIAEHVWVEAGTKGGGKGGEGTGGGGEKRVKREVKNAEGGREGQGGRREEFGGS
jgi:hypothetical protein